VKKEYSQALNTNRRRKRRIVTDTPIFVILLFSVYTIYDILNPFVWYLTCCKIQSSEQYACWYDYCTHHITKVTLCTIPFLLMSIVVILSFSVYTIYDILNTFVWYFACCKTRLLMWLLYTPYHKRNVMYYSVSLNCWCIIVYHDVSSYDTPLHM